MYKQNAWLLSSGWVYGGYKQRKHWYQDPQDIRGWFDEKMAVIVQKSREK